MLFLTTILSFAGWLVAGQTTAHPTLSSLDTTRPSDWQAVPSLDLRREANPAKDFPFESLPSDLQFYIVKKMASPDLRSFVQTSSHADRLASHVQLRYHLYHDIQSMIRCISQLNSACFNYWMDRKIFTPDQYFVLTFHTLDVLFLPFQLHLQSIISGHGITLNTMDEAHINISSRMFLALEGRLLPAHRRAVNETLFRKWEYDSQFYLGNQNILAFLEDFSIKPHSRPLEDMYHVSLWFKYADQAHELDKKLATLIRYEPDLKLSDFIKVLHQMPINVNDVDFLYSVFLAAFCAANWDIVYYLVAEAGVRIESVGERSIRNLMEWALKEARAAMNSNSRIDYPRAYLLFSDEKRERFLDDFIRIMVANKAPVTPSTLDNLIFFNATSAIDFLCRQRGPSQLSHEMLYEGLLTSVRSPNADVTKVLLSHGQFSVKELKSLDNIANGRVSILDCFMNRKLKCTGSFGDGKSAGPGISLVQEAIKTASTSRKTSSPSVQYGSASVDGYASTNSPSCLAVFDRLWRPFQKGCPPPPNQQ